MLRGHHVLGFQNGPPTHDQAMILLILVLRREEFGEVDDQHGMPGVRFDGGVAAACDPIDKAAMFAEDAAVLAVRKPV